LRCSVSIILQETCCVLEHPEDWEIGKHGIRIEFAHNGKKYSKVYPPETILARGWSKKEAVEAGIKKAGFAGELTTEFMDTVKITRFQTSTCIVSFKDYFRHVTEQESKRSDNNDVKQKTIRRRRRRYIRQWAKRVKEDKESLTSSGHTDSGHFGGNWWTYVLILAIVAVFFGVFVMRFYEVTYDQDYEEFQSNYDILGLERGASLQQVKKAYRKLSLQWHPDKNKDRKECAEKFIQISKAYKEITDYERGVLRLVNKTTTNPKS